MTNLMQKFSKQFFGTAIRVVTPPNGDFAYVTKQIDNTVSVISTASNTVTATILVGANPGFMDFEVLPPTPAAFISNSHLSKVTGTGQSAQRYTPHL
jgi:YVTN family beta-propeller protein